MNKHVYISIPLYEQWQKVEELTKSILEPNNIAWKAWGRGKYTKEEEYDLLSSKAIIFILPGNKFRMDYDDLPSVVKNDLDRALTKNIPIYIAYKTTAGILQIYEAMLDDYLDSEITGIQGSYDKFLENFKQLNLDNIYFY